MATTERFLYAVCPRIERDGTIREPQLFQSESEAKRFLDAEVVFPDPEVACPVEIEAAETRLSVQAVREKRSEKRAKRAKEFAEATAGLASGELHPLDYPDHFEPIRNKHQGWQGPVPICRVADYSGLKCNLSLRDFLPLDTVGAMPKWAATEEIERANEGRFGDFMCVLDGDWRFDEIEVAAKRGGGHEFAGRRYSSIGEIVVRAVHDLESVFQKFHPNAPRRAVADFWRSWQVQHHIACFCCRVAESGTAVGPVGKKYVELGREVERARRFTYRQLAAFAHEVLDGEKSAVEPEPAQPPFGLDDGDSVHSPAASWDTIEISFLSDERVQIRNGREIETRNYAELGFADRRAKRGKPKPNQAWVTLRAMAEMNGIIRDGAKTGAAWPKVEKRIQEIRKVLRKHFSVNGDPIPFIEGTGYQARFKKIGCSPSFRT